MIYKIVKDFFLKRKVNSKLRNYQLQMSSNKIVRVGVLIDANYFTNQEDLINVRLPKRQPVAFTKSFA